VKPSTVHQEFRVLRRVLNVAVRKRPFIFEPLLWGGVSARREKDVSTALRSLVGTAKNRIPCTGVSVQCDSNRHGDRHAHL
jgi:hypothetical protein